MLGGDSDIHFDQEGRDLFEATLRAAAGGDEALLFHLFDKLFDRFVKVSLLTRYSTDLAAYVLTGYSVTYDHLTHPDFGKAVAALTKDFHAVTA